MRKLAYFLIFIGFEFQSFGVTCYRAVDSNCPLFENPREQISIEGGKYHHFDESGSCWALADRSRGDVSVHKTVHAPEETIYHLMSDYYKPSNPEISHRSYGVLRVNKNGTGVFVGYPFFYSRPEWMKLRKVELTCEF